MSFNSLANTRNNFQSNFFFIYHSAQLWTIFLWKTQNENFSRANFFLCIHRVFHYSCERRTKKLSEVNFYVGKQFTSDGIFNYFTLFSFPMLVRHDMHNFLGLALLVSMWNFDLNHKRYFLETRSLSRAKKRETKNHLSKKQNCIFLRRTKYYWYCFITLMIEVRWLFSFVLIIKKNYFSLEENKTF